MFSLTTETVLAFIGIYITILGSVWGLGRYLDGRFSKVFEKIESVKDQLLGKLEYHERHDDKRFSEIREDLWEAKYLSLKNLPTRHGIQEKPEDD